MFALYKTSFIEPRNKKTITRCYFFLWQSTELLLSTRLDKNVMFISRYMVNLENAPFLLSNVNI